MSDNCSICLTPLSQGDLAIQDGCRHIHHDECVRAWLETRSFRRWSCPICRKRIRTIQTIPNFNLPEERQNGQEAVNLEPDVNQDAPPAAGRNEVVENVDQEGGGNENEGNAEQEEEPEVIILDPPTPPPVPRPSTVNERNQDNSQGIDMSIRNVQSAPFLLRPIVYMNPTYGSQSTAAPVQGQHLQVPPSSNLVLMQPVSFLPIPGRPTGAQFIGEAVNSMPQPQQLPQASSLQQFASASHFPGFSRAAVPATLPLNQENQTFVCATCHVAFRLRNSLYRHTRRVHQGRLDCPVPACTRTFTDRSRLRHHLNNDHLE